MIEEVAVVLLRHIQALLEGPYPVADDQGADVVLHELLEGLEPLFRAEGVQIGALHPAYHLDAVGVEVIVKAGELHGGAVHVGGFDKGRLIVLGSVQGLELVFLHQRFKFDRILAYHGAISVPEQ